MLRLANLFVVLLVVAASLSVLVFAAQRQLLLQAVQDHELGAMADAQLQRSLRLHDALLWAAADPDHAAANQALVSAAGGFEAGLLELRLPRASLPWRDEQWSASRRLLADAESAGQAALAALSRGGPDGRATVLRHELAHRQAIASAAALWENAEAAELGRLHQLQILLILTKLILLAFVAWAAVRPAIERIRTAVDELVATQEHLRRREQHFRALTANAYDLISVLDSSGRIAYISPSARRLLGYRPDEPVGRKALDLVHPDDREVAIEAMERLRAGDVEDLRGEFRIEGHDGGYYPFEVIARNLTDDPAVGGLVINARDIGERQRAEERLRLKTMELEAVLDAFPDLHFRLTHDGRILECRAQQPELLLLVTNGSERIGTALPAPLGDRVAAGAAEVAAGAALVQIEESCALGAETRVFEARLLPLPGGQVMAILRDITARKEAETRLAEARDAAVEAARVKSEFVASVSHELRTPLNGVLGMTNLLMETDLTPEQRGYADAVRSCGSGLLALINDLLDVAKMEAGRLSLEPLPFDLRRTIEQAMGLLAPRADDKGLRLLLDYAADAPEGVVADPVRVRQVISNLVDNAIKFTAEGHVLVTLSCLAREPGQALLRLAVEDTGIGIPADKLEAVFEQFAQADASTTRRYGGTGLGLAICRQLVELMGGTLGVESEPERGSTFWMELPLPLHAIAVEHPPACPGRVLLVDEHALAREVLSRQLDSLGVAWTAAASLPAAFAALDAAEAAGAPFRIVLLDHALGDAAPESLPEALRPWPTSAPVLIAPLAWRSDAVRLRALGFADVLVKPVARDALITLLAEPASAPARAAHPPLGGEVHVLLAEDNAVNQKVAVRMLERLGCRVDIASDGREAVEMATRHDYDLVFMDCQMPAMDGYTATAEIRRRRNGHGRRLPIVALTASGSPDEPERCLQAGMDELLPKPVRPETLDAAVRRWARADTAAAS